MKIRPDILIEIDYDMRNPANSQIRTNAKVEALEELLGSWLQDQMCTRRPAEDCYVRLDTPVVDEHYLIRIGLCLDGDVFYTNHNCDNHALAVGIIAKGLPTLNEIQIGPLQ